MDKLFRVIIAEIDPETNIATEVHNALHSGMTCLLDSPDGEGFTEVVLHDSIGNIAQKIKDSNHCKKAAMLAMMFGFGNDDKESEDK